ncbi:3570_t:CDS:2 [Ambispora gerdemannii]|uniref:3570_t:CDS:1 n=1 Tax=Ambispora gerdemannii TaxID=144530 RepID=A0A9N9GF51_9GLOM|nr:3570_t:CDS:2 [Ambispora gerdemannii]
MDTKVSTKNSEKTHLASETNNEKFDCFQEYEEKVLLRKIDYRFIPLFAAMFFFSQIDRTNIGNAKITSFPKDIGVNADQFLGAISIFFLGYAIFDVPNNLMLKHYGVRFWLSFIMVGWGICSMSMAAVENVGGLYALRVLLAFRLGCIFALATIGIAFSGVLAYGILQLEGYGELKGWQYLFLIEGIGPILFSTVVFFWMPENPEAAKFLTPKEKKLIKFRLKFESTSAITDREVARKQIIALLKDWRTYMYCLISFTSGVTQYVFGFFLPTILVSFGYDALKTQLMSSPPQFFALLIILPVAYSSGRFLERGYHIAGSCALALAGFIPLIAYEGHNTNAKYIFTTLALTGTNASISLGGIVAGQIYRAHDAPRYLRGHIIAMSFIILQAVASLGLKFYLVRENKRRDALPKDPRYPPDETFNEELCDDHPNWRYVT